MNQAICPLEKCTGCGACMAVCPKHCIELKPNPQGHLFPAIDKKACVNCHLCRSTCPVNTPVELRQPQACYAGWSRDEKDRITSSSGAASSVFARHIISRGGTVYGAVLQDNQVRHIRVHRPEELVRLKGSKYVYSYAADVYAQIKQDVKAGKQVLFIGTPCQNAAVCNVVGQAPNLTLINLICHGTPSLQMLTDHLKAKKITQIHNIQFRNNSNIYDFVCNNYRALDSVWPDCYVNLFLQGLSYRPVCYQCVYAKSQRVGDITIGDFWKLGQTIPFSGGDVAKGCSVILVNTDKGKQLVDECREKLQLFPREYAEAVAGNAQLRRPVTYTNTARLFNKWYPRLSFEKAAWLAASSLLLLATLKRIFTLYAPKCFQRWGLALYVHLKKQK